ncbi:unnamed protein product [Clonostachys rosea f. rosea IK726]|nr:unnamed protein product [Clonostachys rosea f. rosea IK726]
MAFNGTAKDIHLEDDHMLCVKLRNNSQDYVDASLDLNDVVQNTNGFLSLDLATEGFADSTKNISLMVDDDGHVMLCADAQKNDGSYRRQSIRIDKKFENIDGVLIYTGE